MLVNNKHTGYGRNHGNIWYVSVWDNEAFEKHGNMKFYVYDMTMIVDIQFNTDKSGILVGTYPHNDQNKVIVTAHEKEQAIYNLLEKAIAENPGRTVFTIDMLKEPRLIRGEDFTSYAPQYHPPRDEMFIYVGETEEEFPQIFFMQESQRKGAYGGTFPVMAMAADVVMNAEDSTLEGNEFVYRILNSYLHMEWIPEVPPISRLSFPDNGKKEVPQYLQINALKELADKVGAEQVIMKDGKITYVEKEEEKSEEITTPGAEAIAREVFGLPDTKGIEMIILRQYEDKNYVNLSEIYQYGLDKTLALLGFSDRVIDVNPDVAGICRKMCIYEGQFHLVPMDRSEQSLVNIFDFLGSNEEVIHICSEMDYPKNLLPAPKLIQ